MDLNINEYECIINDFIEAKTYLTSLWNEIGLSSDDQSMKIEECRNMLLVSQF